MNKISSISLFNEWLDQYLNFEHTPKKNIFWLDTMQFLCRRLGNPQDLTKSFHVAGSKGKGSVSVMIANILQAAGFNTGLYSSPHILDFRERISSPMGFFDDDVYSKAAGELMHLVETVVPSSLPGERPITWFELVTAFAMLCYKYQKCDWTVYEVGLGGRLDATNVILPKCCCITPIELEHMEYLGDTVEKIAAEKGGIIKEGVPVVISRQNYDSCNDVFREIAGQRNAPIIFAQDCGKVSSISYNKNKDTLGMDIVLESQLFSRPIRTRLKLVGEYQAENALAASIAIKTALPEISEDVIEKGLSEAVLPGRFELLHDVPSYPKIPCLVMDGAHTVCSVDKTLKTFDAVFSKDCEAHLLFGCASDKDADHIASLIPFSFTHITLTKPGEIKSSDLPAMEKAFSKAGLSYCSCTDYVKAIATAFKNADEQGVPLLVMGSFYLVAEVKKFLVSKECDLI
ncbi:MAG: bifunctional folylpolyglutamate synthase/dihydrofolate synthase [Treponema sp.]|nr:bifunctional folylpolyglutamate synthase/dihydrofolate synthase [Treponema sp.]